MSAAALSRAALAASTRRQRAVVEYHGAAEWWVLLPSGDVRIVTTPEAALRAVQRAAARGNKTITITTIEWRDTPEGFTPPQGAQS